MSNLAKHWPVVRQVAYGLLAAALAVAAAAGWITQDNADQWLAHAVTALGAIGFIVAGLYVDRPSPAQEQKIEQAVEAGLRHASGPVLDLITHAAPAAAHAQSELERVRAEAERLLGNR